MFYSKSTGGFYDAVIHGENIPADAVEITDEYHSILLEAQSSGRQITADENGHPIAINPPKPTISPQSLLAGVANKRWEVETGGVMVGGHRIATDRESQAQLNSAYSSLKLGLIDDTPWEDASGNFTLVTLVELEPVARAVAQHVRACFTAEQAHTVAINGLTTQAQLDAYDVNEGWPSNN